jgi:acetylornithine deacetylase/succinyl-diaminopimelate desuccinylase-like protein
MSRTEAVAAAQRYFDERGFHADLVRRVAIPTESQNPERRDALRGYLDGELIPSLAALGFRCEVFPNPVAGGGSFLVAQRIEDPTRLTLLSYGHGDVIRGLEPQWREGITPWQLRQEGDRLYGRGTADSQHTVNIGALAAALKARGSRGFNAKLLIEMGEEMGSVGLSEFCAAHKDLLKADVFIASDGPRISPTRPTIFLGSRGVINFDLSMELRKDANDVFSGTLGLPALWVPHSYSACSQHAPNEHVLGAIARDGLAIMAGLFHDLGRMEKASA